MATEDLPTDAATEAELFCEATSTDRKCIWFFTLNDIEDQEVWNMPDPVKHKIVLYSWQWERGAEGKLHLQGAFKTKDAKTKSAVLKWFKPKQPYLRIPYEKSSLAKIMKYVTKEETRVELGAQYGDIEAALADDRKFTSMREQLCRLLVDFTPHQLLANEEVGDFVFKHWKLAVELSQHINNAPRENLPITALWIYGKPRTGKSNYVNTLPNVFRKDLTGQFNNWWCGMKTSQEWCALEDFDRDSMRPGDLKRLLDPYPVNVQVKYGGEVPLHFTKIVITSNYLPEHIFNAIDAQAIRERVEVWQFSVKDNILYRELMSKPKTFTPRETVDVGGDLTKTPTERHVIPKRKIFA